MTSGQAFKYCNVHTELHTCVGQPVFTSQTAVLLQNNLHRDGRQTAQRRHKEEAAPPSAGRSTGSWRHDGAEANEEGRSTALPSPSAKGAQRDSPHLGQAVAVELEDAP